MFINSTIKTFQANKIDKINNKISFQSKKLIKIGSKIDHTFLPPVTTDLIDIAINDDKVEKLCRQAKKYDFPAVCVRPDSILIAKNILKGSDVKVATVIGFPDCKLEKDQAVSIVGSASIEQKVSEAKNTVKSGVDELDVVINVARVKAKDKAYVTKEAEQLLNVANGKLVKFIIETGLLTDSEKRFVTNCIIDATRNIRIAKNDPNLPCMVKTSTGMVKDVPGATVKDIELIKSLVNDHNIQIKASGGIKDADSAMQMINAGADRIGTSKGINIVRDPEGYKYREEKVPSEKVVAIYGSSRTRPQGLGAEHYHEAEELGTLLAKKGYGVLTGGSVGTMEAANKGCLENGGHSVGVTLDLLDTEQKPNNYLDESYRYNHFYPRLDKYRDRSGYQVAGPGGIGTLMEIFDMAGMILTNKADKGPDNKHQKQVIMYDKEFYQGLIDWIWDQPVKKGYISPETMNLFKLVQTPKEVVKEIDRGIDYDPAGIGKRYAQKA